MKDTKRAAYERLVKAALLIEEASVQAARAASAAHRARESLGRIASGVQPIADLSDVLQLMDNSLQRSTQCTQEASTLIKVA